MAAYTCPFCNAQISEAEMVGTQCPHCRQQFVVDVPRPGGETQPKDQPAPASLSAPEWSRWGAVRVGLTFMIWGSILGGVFVLGHTFAICLAGTPPENLAETVQPRNVGNAVFLGGAALASLPFLSGVLLSCIAPREAGTRVWALLLLFTLLTLAGALVIILCCILNIPPQIQGTTEFLLILLLCQFLLVILIVLLVILIVMMLRTLANSAGEETLGGGFLNWLAAAAIYGILIATAYGIVNLFLSREDTGAVHLRDMFCGGCDLIIRPILLVWWVRLLWQLRKTVPSATRQISLRRSL